MNKVKKYYSKTIDTLTNNKYYKAIDKKYNITHPNTETLYKRFVIVHKINVVLFILNILSIFAYMLITSITCAY